MVRRICPSCGASWYSSDTSNEEWICQKCGAKIPKSQEEVAK